MALKRYFAPVGMAGYFAIPWSAAIVGRRSGDCLEVKGSPREKACHYTLFWGAISGIEAAKAVGYGYAAYGIYNALF